MVIFKLYRIKSHFLPNNPQKTLKKYALTRKIPITLKKESPNATETQICLPRVFNMLLTPKNANNDPTPIVFCRDSLGSRPLYSFCIESLLGSY
jgi:hypothetical protein